MASIGDCEGNLDILRSSAANMMSCKWRSCVSHEPVDDLKDISPLLGMFKWDHWKVVRDLTTDNRVEMKLARPSIVSIKRLDVFVGKTDQSGFAGLVIWRRSSCWSTAGTCTRYAARALSSWLSKLRSLLVTLSLGQAPRCLVKSLRRHCEMITRTATGTFATPCRHVVDKA